MQKRRELAQVTPIGRDRVGGQVSLELEMLDERGDQVIFGGGKILLRGHRVLSIGFERAGIHLLYQWGRSRSNTSSADTGPLERSLVPPAGASNETAELQADQ